MTLFVDTSALAGLYYPERFSDKIEEIVLNADQVLVSRLTEVELAAALSHKVRIGDITHAEREEIWGAFQSDLLSVQVRIVELMPAMISYAAELIPKYGDNLGLQPLDALQLATAKIAGAKIFLCADHRMVVGAGCVGLDAPMGFL